MITQAKVSIFIPLYNAEKYISQTIESVLNQTFKDWELIVLDDCSTDNSYEIAKAFEAKDSRIQVKKNTQNLGMMGNWNEGIKYCKAEYFVKLDADDLWHPEILEKSLEILEKIPEVGLVFTKYINIDENGVPIRDSEIALPVFAQNKPFSCVPLVQSGVDKMLSYSILRQGLSVMRRKIFDEIGVYRHLLTPETQASTDTEFYFRVGCHYQIYCINHCFYYYRIHTKSISSIDKNQGLQERKMFEVNL
ncbi:MAG: glycosyltransferase family 2 protein [Microscillaceae bacterium]|nr:glycosyltransferase family 2 protein [Microscillaceae bacterium]